MYTWVFLENEIWKEVHRFLDERLPVRRDDRGALVHDDTWRQSVS